MGRQIVCPIPYLGGRNRPTQIIAGSFVLLIGSLLTLGGIGSVVDGRAGDGLILLIVGVLTLGGFALAAIRSWRTRPPDTAEPFDLPE